MSDDDYSEDELREIHKMMLERGPTAVWARVQDRRGRGRTGSIEATAGSSTDVTGEVERLKRRMTGRAGGAPRGTGLTFDRLVEAAIGLREPDGTWPTEEAVAESEMVGRSVERVRQVARPRGGFEAVLTEARRRSG